MQKLYPTLIKYISTRSALAFLLAFLCMSFNGHAQLSITCPANISQGNDLGLCSAVVNYTAPIGAGTGTNLSTNLTLGLPSGETFPVGVTEVQYTVTNDEGDEAICSFFVTVLDLEDPVFDCPGDITVIADPEACNALAIFDIPSASDNCAVVDVFQLAGLPSGSIFPVGESSVDFQAIDADGNSAFCRIVINVIDVTDPIITCPDDITVEVIASCQSVVNFIAPVGSDACTISNTVQTAGLVSGSIFPLGTTVQTYTVSDLEGNTASCTFNINVVDIAAPVITCPADVLVAAAPGMCEAVVTYGSVTATDNCPGVAIAQTEGLPSGSAFPAGVNSITFTATDGSGNTSECSFTVTVIEIIDPEIACPANIEVGTDSGECSAVVFYTPPVGTDNCAGSVTTIDSGIGSGGTFPLGTSTETYTVTDASGNTATCSFDVVVTDTEAPAISCPGNLEVIAPVGDCEAVVNFVIPGFSDNCPGGSIAQTGGAISGSIFPVGSSEIEFTAIDAVGNSSICTINIIVIDEENPEITCPGDVEVLLNEANCEGTIIYNDPVVTDNCPGVTFELIAGPASGATVTAGVYNVSFEATDASGNVAECTFEVTVVETNPPVFDCPDDITAQADPSTCEAIVNFDPPVASDPCSALTVTQTDGPPSGSVFPVGSTTVTFTAEDAFGNSSTCTFSVIVNDANPPEITCPEDITTANDPGECGAVVNYLTPVAIDDCGAVDVTLIEGFVSGSLFPIGNSQITFEATDLSGNTAVCSFTVVVNDEEAPELNCPADIIIALPADQCSQVVDYPTPGASDNCAVIAVNLAEGPASGEVFSVGTTTVTFEAIDEAGNISTCSFSVSITESVDPTISCPANINVPNEAGTCGATVNYTLPVGEDNCEGAGTALTIGLGSGAFFPVGTTTETYTVTDLSGNTAECSFTVTVTDTEDPVFECLEDITIPNAPGSCEATLNYSIPTVTDNCDGPLLATLVDGPVSGSTQPVGIYTVVYEASDLAGNTTQCSFTLIVEDTEAPEITCPEDIAVAAALGDCNAIVNFPPPTFDDNCGIASFNIIDGLLSGALFPIGLTTVTFEVIDVNGLSATCSFTVTVSESVPPTIVCPENIEVPNDPGTCSAVVNYTTPIVDDDCSPVSPVLIEGLASGAVFPLGSTTVSYEVTDGSGNTASCSFEVVVLDSEAPVFDCPLEAIELENETALCGAAYTFDFPEANDNCTAEPSISQIDGPMSGTFLPVGETSFSFTATDAAGNESTCTYTVNVIDTESPEFTFCPGDISIEVSDEGPCEFEVSFDLPEATDNCGATTTQVSGPENGDTLLPGNYEVVFEASDAAGNTSTCNFIINVIDNIAPELTCLENFESCDNIVVFDFPFAADNCSEVEVLQIEGLESGAIFPLGSSTVTFEATDESGNSSTCTFEIVILPNAPRAEVGVNINICGETSTVLNGNDPDFALGTWILIDGFGDIESPNSASTVVNDLGVGSNVFVWSIDPLNGCTVQTDTIQVTVEPGVQVDAGEDQLILVGGQAAIFAIAEPPGGSFIWQPPAGLSCTTCSNPVASPLVTTEYFVTYTTLLDCQVTDSITIRVFEDLPNTITPNNDGVNDVWNIPGIENFPNVQVLIYNRWGSEIYSSTGYNDPWDGRRNGDDLPAGSYFYIIDYKQSGQENLNGTVNIIR